MLSDQLRQLAASYVVARKAKMADPTDEGLSDRASEAYDQFVVQLKQENISYFDDEDATRIATGIVERTYDLLYHQCGRAIILDGEVFRIYGGDLAGHVIQDCPGCGRRLDAFDLYADPGGATRNLLRQAGLYPTADGLVLMEDPEQRAAILQDLERSLNRLGDGDLLATYAVVVALLRDSLGNGLFS